MIKNLIKRIINFFSTDNNKSQDRVRLATQYNQHPFAIVANNCWGAEIYKELNQPFNTPFIGLFIYGPDFVKLLSNFDQYAKLDLTFTNTSKWIKNKEKFHYPIGLLNDVEIHFLHYKTEDEANAKWTKRMKRLLLVDKKNWYLKICDRDEGLPEVLSQFHNLNYTNKISFSIYDLPIQENIKILESENGKYVVDGVKLFDVTNKYVDIINWINTGKVQSV